MKIPRKQKKKLRQLLLCYTGNPKARYEKLNGEKAFNLKNKFLAWFNLFSRHERKISNTI